MEPDQGPTLVVIPGPWPKHGLLLRQAPWNLHADGQQDFDIPLGPGLDRLRLIAAGARSRICKLKSSLEVDPVEVLVELLP